MNRSLPLRPVLAFRASVQVDQVLSSHGAGGRAHVARAAAAEVRFVCHHRRDRPLARPATAWRDVAELRQIRARHRPEMRIHIAGANRLQPLMDLFVSGEMQDFRVERLEVFDIEFRRRMRYFSQIEALRATSSSSDKRGAIGSEVPSLREQGIDRHRPSIPISSRMLEMLSVPRRLLISIPLALTISGKCAKAGGGALVTACQI